MIFLVITMSRKADWQSVKVISRAMEKLYQKTARQMDQHSFRFFEVDLTQVENDFLFGNGYILQLIQKINSFKADTIIFPEPHVSQFPIIDLILKNDSRLKKNYIFYLYGSFTNYIEKWLALEKSLHGKNVSFITASCASQALISSFFKEKSIVKKIPYPINFEQFYFSQDKRKEFRKKHDVKRDEKVFLYAGRISEQKNILQMIQLFEKGKADQLPAKIFLAGSSDDLSNEVFGKKNINGQFYKKLQKAINKLPKQLQEKIHFLGHLSQEDLRKAFNGSDFLISLSTHHDEDYGIVITQALKTGLPCLLSPWGGYKDFLRDSQHCSPLHFTSKQGKIRFDQDQFSQWFSHALSSQVRRTEEDLYPEKSIIEELKSILLEDIPSWKGFEQQAYQLAESKKKGLTLYQDSLYHKIYQHYL